MTFFFKENSGGPKPQASLIRKLKIVYKNPMFKMPIEFNYERHKIMRELASHQKKYCPTSSNSPSHKKPKLSRLNPFFFINQ